MNTKTLFLLATSMCLGLAHGESTISSATPYDFNTIIVSGTAGESGTVTVGGTSHNVAAGNFTETFTELTAGRLYQVSVNAGGTASTEVLMANGAVDRFSASAATGASVVSDGSWALSPVPTITENKYVFAGSSNRFEATSRSTDAVFYVDSNMTFDDGADELAPMEALGAFTLAQTNENDSTDFFWAGLVKENSAAKWIALTANGVTAETGTYVVRMEFDFSGSDAKVRYWIKSGNGNFVLLKKDTTEWFDVAKNETGVSSVSYEGTGKLAQLTGSSVTAHVAQIGETKYASLPAALTAAKEATPVSAVTLLTNSRLTPTSELKGTYTLNSSPYDFRLLTAAGLEATYSGTTLTIADWVNSVTMSSEKTIGCDFTNGTVTVNLSNLHIQSGTTLSATVTVKDASGTTVATKNGNFTAAGSLALNTEITAQNNYTYEVTVSDGSKTLAAATNSFVAGSEANWFSAKQGAWADYGSWKLNGEATKINTAKIALAGNQYDFVIGSARPGAPNGVVRVDTVVEVDGAIDNDDLEAIDKTGAQGMITIAETSAENPTAVWKAYVGNSWLTLAGENPEVANVTYTVRAEFDYRTSSKKVRYSVSKNGGNFAMLTYNSNEWLDNNVSEATTLTNTCAVGAGNLVSLAGSDINYYLASVDGTKYESMSSAFANAAFGSTVTMLWDATWKPNRAGCWTIGGTKNLTILNGGLVNKTSDNVIQVSDAKVAKVGATEYDFLDEAFGAATTDGATVQLLTNVVQGLAVTAPATANLDLNGCFVTFPSATLTVESGKTLFVTNGCNFVGGFNGTIEGTYKIAGGKWAAGEKDAGLFFDGYKMMPLSITETVDGVTYTLEAMKTQADPTKAAVVPVVIVNGTETNLSSVVVSNSFVEAYASGSTAAEKAASLNAPRDAGNKLTLIQSYVLGLTPTDATAKPVVNAVQDAQTDKVTLSLGNVKLNTSAGLPVKFTLKSMTTPGGTATEVETKSNDPSFAVPLYGSGDKVHYYKIDINFGK